MIKNIIFDLAGVLIDCHPEIYLAHMGLNKEEIPLFKKLIWESKEWQEGDKGNITYTQVLHHIYQNNPKYATKLKYLLENKNNDFILEENSENCKFFKEIKNRGFKVYFLSNVNTFDLQYNKENFSIFKLVDGAIYSCEVGCVKPEKRCYEILLEKYHLLPEECIFLDDNITNVEVASMLGIYSIYFDTLEKVKQKIEEIILEEKKN